MNTILPNHARDRGQVDDGPAAGFPHGGNAVLHAKENTARIDGHDAIPQRRVIKIVGVAAGNAGIIHQHIKPPMRGKHGRYGGFPLRFIRDIQVDVACGTAGLGDFSDHGAAFGFHHVRHHYLRAFTRQKQCGGSPHAGCRAGNQRNLIRNAHNISSWSFLIR